jgi:phosphoglycerate dehydrogenase-like enzyme
MKNLLVFRAGLKLLGNDTTFCRGYNHMMNIVFHGQNAANFRVGFETLIDQRHAIFDLSDGLTSPGERERYESAEIIVGVGFGAAQPTPKALRLFQAPAAGTDAINVSLLPAGAALCNCFGHEDAIAEYVMAALLMRHVPVAQADADLRAQRWTYWAGRPTALRTELGAQTIGLLGFGHIGKAIAARAKAFGMRVHAANRSPVAHPLVDRAFTLDALDAFMGSVDIVVVSLPQTPETTGFVNANALAAMQSHALIMNVGRGPVIDEAALYDALASQRIGGAIIDTWYIYPSPTVVECAPSRFDFAALPNVVMTPHMSGWTSGTVTRRQQKMAENIARLVAGQPLLNVVKAAQ